MRWGFTDSLLACARHCRGSGGYGRKQDKLSSWLPGTWVKGVMKKQTIQQVRSMASDPDKRCEERPRVSRRFQESCCWESCGMRPEFHLLLLTQTALPFPPRSQAPFSTISKQSGLIAKTEPLHY
uniref:Uncharacterized protein n=1 Tax=Molossus molossus TaxID=27622 RepID=A0A7J8JXD2_MOLMO|nr:hypothetical protein HJG59_007998 [Molossus molossus]